DAFPDIKEAQRAWADPARMVVVEEGAISKGKIMAKPGAGLPSSYIQMMQIADQMFYNCSGLNPEILAMNSNDQPGIVEAQRKQSARTIWAPDFDARKTMLSAIGHIRLHFMKLFGNRLIRLTGPQGYQAIRLNAQMLAGEFDIEIEDAPNSPDIKTQTWH